MTKRKKTKTTTHDYDAALARAAEQKRRESRGAVRIAVYGDFGSGLRSTMRGPGDLKEKRFRKWIVISGDGRIVTTVHGVETFDFHDEMNAHKLAAIMDSITPKEKLEAVGKYRAIYVEELSGGWL